MSILDNFLTWDVLLTYSGCIAGTVLLTEFLKKVFSKIPAQIVSFVIAALILFVGHWATGTLVWTEAPLYLVNAVAVSLAANGGFDALKKIFGKTDVVTEELILDTGDDGTYLNLSKDPKEFKDGEVVSFAVRKINQNGSEKE